MESNNKISVILTGATGMVGEGVLLECLQHPQVDAVLAINRKTCGVHHAKLKEIIHKDFFDVTPILNQLAGYNTCFFCLGVSSVGMKEEEYKKITYSLTLHFAEALVKINPALNFSYISGAGTNSSEEGRIMWARIKGKTENDLMKLAFKDVYAFRPGFMYPTKGMNNTPAFYKYITWLYPAVRKLFPQFASTLKELGLAMINAALQGYDKKILEVKDIVELAKR